LSQRCNETLTIASVVGREFELRQLVPLVEDVSEDRLLEVLEEALAARVIEELPQSVGRYQFTHALIQETLSEELSTTRRVRLHARIAEALEELYGKDSEAHAAELAHHFAEAQTVMGAEKLVHYSLRAGERALASYAWEEAVDHFERALAAKGVPSGGAEPAQDLDSAALLFGLGRAQVAMLERHQLQEAMTNLRRAFDFYVASGDFDRLVAVAETPYVSLPGHSTGMAQLIGRALELIPPDSHRVGRLQGLYGKALGWEEGDIDGAQAALSVALSIAERENDTGLEMQTLAASCLVNFIYSRWHDILVPGRRAIELASSVDDPNSEMAARYWSAFAYICLGDLEAAGPHASVILPLAERLKDRFSLASALWPNELVSHLRGDWQASRDFSDRNLAVSPLDPRLLFTRIPLEHEVGNFDLGDTLLDQAMEVMRQAPRGPNTAYASVSMAIALAARIAGTTARLDDAETAAQTVLSFPNALPVVATIARVSLAMIAVQRGDATAAQQQYEALNSYRATTLVGMIAADRLLGLLAHTTGRLDQAAEHFEDSLSFCRRTGCRPELAWTCCDYADMLLARDGKGDRDKAISLLDESLDISSELGMRPLMERVQSRREIL